MTKEQKLRLALARANLEALASRERLVTRCGFGMNDAGRKRLHARRQLVRAADDHLQQLLDEVCE